MQRDADADDSSAENQNIATRRGRTRHGASMTNRASFITICLLPPCSTGLRAMRANRITFPEK
jgi:hypothetical protein